MQQLTSDNQESRERRHCFRHDDDLSPVGNDSFERYAKSSQGPVEGAAAELFVQLLPGGVNGRARKMSRIDMRQALAVQHVWWK